MTSLLIRGARVLTMKGPPGPRRGAALSDLGVLECADVLMQDGRIAEVSTTGISPRDVEPDEVILAEGRVLMPAFVDSHTHACWAGDRLDEWEQKLRGATYLELLKSGGGIGATVRAVRAATVDSLAEQLLGRLRVMLRHGTTAVEIKSGYGLSTESELNMLRAIRAAAERWPGRVQATACLGHALDPETDPASFVRRTIEETLPAVSAEFPGIAVDAYCEQGAWTRDDCLRLFDAAQQLGHPVRVHADQFHSLGLIPAAIRRGYRSVDHLEATSNEDLENLARSNVFGVMLPCTGFHLDGRYANGRRFIDAGGQLAIATNFNPGSAPCSSMPMALALAVRHLGLAVAEALVAATLNPALLLDFADAGSIQPGQRADLILLRHRDERQLAHEFGGNPVEAVICGGALVAAS